MTDEEKKAKSRARQKAYRDANIEKVRARNKAYREANIEKVRVRDKAYRDANREKHNARKRAYYEASREKHLARQKAYRDANREKHNARKKAYRGSNIEASLVQTAKSRSKKESIPFNLTSADIDIPSHCPVLGIEISVGSGKPGPGSPSLDRIKPDSGYVKGNVMVISYRANTLKSNANADELQRVADYVREQERRIQEYFDKGMSHFTPASKPKAKTEKAKWATL